MISRPILKKELKCNGDVYKLELWGAPSREPAGSFTSYIDNSTTPIYDPSDKFNPPARRDFFNKFDMEGNWASAAKDYAKGFQSWFDNLSIEKQKAYVKAIDESNRIIISMVWDILLPEDKQELFNNNLRQFSNWFTGLDVSDVDFYMSRIMSKKRLMPLEFRTEPSMLTEQEITVLLEEVYDKIDDDLVRATSINGLLCISCTDEDRLNKAKKHMIKHGSILRDSRKKENANGRIIYTYIFSKP